MPRAVLWGLATMMVGLLLLAGIWGLALTLTMLITGGRWEWVCAAAIAFWPAWRGYAALALAGEATIAAWRSGSTFERELAWAALQASVGPGQAASMEVSRITGQPAPVKKPKVE